MNQMPVATARVAHHENRARLAAFGWRTEDDRSTVVADSVETLTWHVARSWTTAKVVALGPKPGTGYRFILTVEGRGSLTTGGQQLTLEPSTMVIIDAEATAEARLADPWAKMEWVLDSANLGMRSYARLLNRTIQISDIHRQLIGSITNTILNEFNQGTKVDELSLKDVLGGLMYSACARAETSYAETGKTSQCTIINEALNQIEVHHTDPDFSVNTLLQKMTISTAQLHRVFAAIETTPRREIERRRVRSARGLLAVYEVNRADEFEDVAHRSGFSSVRQMRDALRRWA